MSQRVSFCVTDSEKEVREMTKSDLEKHVEEKVKLKKVYLQRRDFHTNTFEYILPFTPEM